MLFSELMFGCQKCNQIALHIHRQMNHTCLEQYAAVYPVLSRYIKIIVLPEVSEISINQSISQSVSLLLLSVSYMSKQQ